MKERPILFSGPMVRAIREGRKTQTRRIIKPQPSETHWDIIPGYKLLVNGPHNLSCGRLGWRFQHCIPQNPVGDKPTWAVCPYGKPGDRLWVKETWAQVHPGMLQSLDPDPDSPLWETVYRADTHGGYVESLLRCTKWRPSIFMPRRFSRITLEIISVRVERLQDITEEDAIAEGCPFSNMHDGPNPVEWYKDLWESLNGHGSWDLNPYVWVIEFKEAKS